MMKPWRLVDQDTMARAAGDPTVTDTDRLVLEALSGWPKGHRLTLDALAEHLPSLGRDGVAEAVDRLEGNGWIAPGKVR